MNCFYRWIGRGFTGSNLSYHQLLKVLFAKWSRTRVSAKISKLSVRRVSLHFSNTSFYINEQPLPLKTNYTAAFPKLTG